jgi:dienelactone hydrolase
MRARRLLAWFGLALAILAVVGGTGVVGFVRGWYVQRRTPAELAALLRPGERIFRPDGPGPFPAVIQFHGCGGPHAADETWARFFVSQGWVAVTVDSLGPRQLQSDWSAVCKGRRLWGRERAGDVLVALDEVRKLPYVDPHRIVLAGWSHGGWSVMDLMALDPPHALPTNLSSAPAAGLEGVAGILLIYPYLGYASLAGSEPIASSAPILMLLSGHDSIVPTAASLRVAARLREQGHDVETHVYEGRDHCWDQTDLHSTRLVYDAAVTADAHTRVASFLARVKSTAPPVSDHPTN